MKPFPFQRADLDKLAANDYRALVAVHPGGGKTALSLFAHLESGSERTLIIAPEQTHGSAWLPTAWELGVDARVIGNTGKGKQQALRDFELGFPGVYVVTPQLFARSDVSAWGGDLVIADEVHGLATPKTAGQRRLSGYSGRDDPISNRFGGRLALSGTPLRNRFELAWSIARFLVPELDGRGQVAHYAFLVWQADRMVSREVFTSRRDRFGNPVKVKQFYGEREPGRWLSELPCVVTHFRRERCCVFHPDGFLPLDEPTVFHEIVPLVGAQKRAIRELETHMVTFLDDNPLVCDIPLTMAQRVRQVVLGVPTLVPDPASGGLSVTFDVDCVSPFLDRLVGLLGSDLEGETAVVYTSSQRFAEVAVARLNAAGVSAFEFSGATRKTRDADVKRFGSDFRVVVATVASIGTGMDGLQRVTNNEVWLDRSLDETDNLQAQGRTDRLGQTKQVVRYFFHDDLGLSEGRFSEAVEKRVQLNKSLKVAA